MAISNEYSSYIADKILIAVYAVDNCMLVFYMQLSYVLFCYNITELPLLQCQITLGIKSEVSDIHGYIIYHI